jgi:DNA polymerase-3 subunit alpha
MPKLSAELGIKLVATNDIHYIEKDHAIALIFTAYRR